MHAHAPVASSFDILLEKSLGIPIHGELLVAYDEWGTSYIAELLEACARRLLTPTLINVPKRLQYEYGRGVNGRTKSVPYILSSALRACQYAVTLLSPDQELTPFRGALLKSERSSDCRLLHIPGISPEALTLVQNSPFDEILYHATKVAQSIGNGSRFELTTRTAGGKICSLGGALRGWDNEPFISPGVVFPGGWGNLPPGEVFFCPQQKGLRGEFCINGSVPDTLVGDKEVVLNVEDGRMTHWDGDPAGSAGRFLAAAEAQAKLDGDDGWNVIAEIGLGLNPAIQELRGDSLFDEKACGTAHIALGDNTCFGHGNYSLIHADLVARNPRFSVDDQILAEAGKIVNLQAAEILENSKHVEQIIEPNTQLYLFNHRYHRGEDTVLVRRLQTAQRIGQIPLCAGPRAVLMNRICVNLATSPGTRMVDLEQEFSMTDRAQIPSLLDYLLRYQMIHIHTRKLT